MQCGTRPVGVADLTLGDGVLLLWYDVYVHADDIRAAIGRPTVKTEGLNAAVAYLVGQLDQRGFDTDADRARRHRPSPVRAGGDRPGRRRGAGPRPDINIYAE